MKKMRRNPRGNLRRAECKVKLFRYPKTWCGCLTPSEILAIVADGARLEVSALATVEQAQVRKALGICNPRWVYFRPSQAQLDRWVAKQKKS
jgi:hypothetical protein